MKDMDWQMLLFVGSSVIHDYWIYWGLPRIYFWDVKRELSKSLNKKDDNNKVA